MCRASRLLVELRGGVQGSAYELDRAFISSFRISRPIPLWSWRFGQSEVKSEGSKEHINRTFLGKGQTADSETGQASVIFAFPVSLPPTAPHFPVELHPSFTSSPVVWVGLWWAQKGGLANDRIVPPWPQGLTMGRWLQLGQWQSLQDSFWSCWHHL